MNLWKVGASVFLLLTISACSFGAAPSTPTQSPAMIYTAAAITVQAELTRVADQTPQITPTPTVTVTPIIPTNTSAPAGPSATPTGPTVSPTAGTPAAATATPAGVGDVCTLANQSVADKTIFTPGMPFEVTWVLHNLGSTTWTVKDYAFRFISDQQMGAPASVPLPVDTKYDGNATITVKFTAPTSIGEYQSTWGLVNPAGKNFCKVWIVIDVASSLPTAATGTPTVTATGQKTATPTSTQAATLTPTPTITATP